MKKILVVGSSSDVAKSLMENKNFEYVQLSRNNGFNILDETTFPKVESLDGLVYFPGTINLKPFDMLKLSDFTKDHEINVLGLVNVLKFYKKYLNKNSSLVFFSTVATKLGMKFHASVSTYKSAIQGLCISLASEFAPNIRVNCIASSIIETKMASRILRNDKIIESISEKHPLKRIGKASDVSNLVRFLLSDDSSWITGQIISVDGGMNNVQL